MLKISIHLNLKRRKKELKTSIEFSNRNKMKIEGNEINGMRQKSADVGTFKEVFQF